MATSILPLRRIPFFPIRFWRGKNKTKQKAPNFQLVIINGNHGWWQSPADPGAEASFGGLCINSAPPASREGERGCWWARSKAISSQRGAGDVLEIISLSRKSVRTCGKCPSAWVKRGARLPSGGHREKYPNRWPPSQCNRCSFPRGGQGGCRRLGSTHVHLPSHPYSSLPPG